MSDSAALSREEREKLKKKEKRAKLKENKKKRKEGGQNLASALLVPVKKEESTEDGKVEIEYVSEQIEAVAGMEDVLNKFMRAEQLLAANRRRGDDESDAEGGGDAVKHEDGQLNNAAGDEKEKEEAARLAKKKQQWQQQQEGEQEAVQLTKQQRKEAKRLKVATLKQMVEKPELVDMHDVSSPDPLFHVFLKSRRGVVAVPRHWRQKRKYLQAKRGADKIPFQLPEYIAATGVATMRAAQIEKDSAKKAKQSARERMQPKLGRLDIDYGVLRDAFFKHQTKPKLTPFGDCYYEGKEYEVDIKTKRPGVLSARLRGALGMQDNSPPPWLRAQQQVGPPPSYPNLRIPGVNAPLPPGCEYGQNGWGNPPVDQYGRPLYGDVYGTQPDDPSTRGLMEQPTIDTSTRWGLMRAEMAVEEEEEESSSDEEDKEEKGKEEASTKQQSDDAQPDKKRPREEPAALESVDVLELRKKAASVVAAMGVQQANADEPKVLARVLEQKQASVGDSLYGSSFQYVIPGTQAGAGAAGGNAPAVFKSQKTEERIVTLDAADLEDLEGGDAAQLLRKKFEQSLEAQEGQGKGLTARDLQEVQDEQAAKKKSKGKKGKSGNKKDFKF